MKKEKVNEKELNKVNGGAHSPIEFEVTSPSEAEQPKEGGAIYGAPNPTDCKA